VKPEEAAVKPWPVTLWHVRLSRPTARLRLSFATTCIGAALAGAAPGSAAPKQPPAAPGTAPVVVRASDGFHWGDAAVGAAAGVGAVIAAMGVITLARVK
jgi:hypothetical protein